jgi:transposase-like protein
MVWFIPTITMGALISLKCPHCKKTQLRAKKPRGTEYVCKFCHGTFSRKDGEQTTKGGRGH